VHIEIFSLCDATTVDTGGKLNILGAFDTIWAANVPVVYPQFAIALRVRFDRSEIGEHKVVFNFVDADGKHLLPSAHGSIHVNSLNDRTSASTNSIINVQQVRIEKYGEYSIDLSIDGKNAASVPLFVMSPQQ
jgi:hypothetical protein